MIGVKRRGYDSDLTFMVTSQKVPASEVPSSEGDPLDIETK